MQSHSTASWSSATSSLELPNRRAYLLGLIAVFAVILLGASDAAAQNTPAEFHQILREKAAFNESDFVAVAQGESVVRLLPANDKKEVAVCGLVSLQTPAEMFLQSFRESMTHKNNPAILEIGRFSSSPVFADLDGLTLDDREIDDLKECVIGDCKLKLSGAMIERLRKEVQWEATDYRIQASRLLKLMLVEYVGDYLGRGDAALIHYNDKPEEVRLGDAQRDLLAASGYLNHALPELPQLLNPAKATITVVENAIVWSKIKFGLKPVIAFNHILVYQLKQTSGPQVLVISKQIYASHYFDSSLALTAFVAIPGANPGSFLFYENRSRADGLGGAFGKLKRRLVEDKAVNSLKTILASSKTNFDARSLQNKELASPVAKGGNWRRFSVSRTYLVIATVITAFLALFAFGNYNWKAGISRSVRY